MFCITSAGASPAAPYRLALGLAAQFFCFLALFPTESAGETRPAENGQVIILTFSQLAACPTQDLVAKPGFATSALPAEIRYPTGKQVQIQGYMLPLVMENGRARELLLMRNQMTCCYGQPPVANEYLVIKTPAPGIAVTMDTPVTFRGTLRVSPVILGGALVEFFHLDNATLVSR